VTPEPGILGLMATGLGHRWGDLRETPNLPTKGDLNLLLNSGRITLKDMFAGRQHKIHTERDRKVTAVRQQRQIRPQTGRDS